MSERLKAEVATLQTLTTLNTVTEGMVDFLEENEVDEVLALLGIEDPKKPVKQETLASYLKISAPQYMTGMEFKKKQLKERLRHLHSLMWCIVLTFSYKYVGRLLHTTYDMGIQLVRFLNIFHYDLHQGFGVRVRLSHLLNGIRFFFSMFKLLLLSAPILALMNLVSPLQNYTLMKPMEKLGPYVTGIQDWVMPKNVNTLVQQGVEPIKDTLGALLNPENRKVVAGVTLGLFIATNAAFIALERRTQIALVRKIQGIFMKAMDRKLKVVRKDMEKIKDQKENQKTMEEIKKKLTLKEGGGRRLRRRRSRRRHVR